MKKIISSLTILSLFACAHQEVSAPKSAPPETERPVSPPLSKESVRGKKAVETDENIDFVGLSRDLGLERASDDLGYKEKAFNTCEVGFGYSKSHNCRQKYFVAMNLRLVCRPTEDTDSTILTAADMTPLRNQSVAWHFKNGTGTTQTDGEGYFQVRASLPDSPRKDRLRLVVGDDFLVMRAGEMSRLVTPKSWCR